MFLNLDYANKPMTKGGLLKSFLLIGIAFYLAILAAPTRGDPGSINRTANINITANYPVNFSVVAGDVTFNVSFDPVNVMPTNVTNVTFYIVNRTGSTFLFNTNTSANVSFVTITNSTTFLPDDVNYQLNVTLRNQTGDVGSIILANFSIDNSAPRISLNLFPRNQTNATIFFNFTVTDVGNGTLSNCTLVQSGAIINSSAADNPVPPNATTGFFVNVVAPNEYASIINCTDIARAGGQFGPFRNSNISVNVSYIIDTSSVLSNNIKIFSFYPFNLSLVRSTVIFNITIDQRVGFAKTNVSNVSFYLTNSSGGPAGGTFFIDINRSANLSAYTIANSTTFLTDGDYALNVTIVNQTGGVGSTILANFSIDNTPPTVIHNIYPVGNQTNNTLLFNFTVFDRGNATILNCTLLVDNTIVNTSNYTSVGAQFANSTEPRNSSLTFVTTERRDHTAFVRCFDTARERDFNGALGNSNESTTITFTTDINSPQFTIKFKDSNENEKTEFTYCSEVTAVCNLSDSSTGVDPRRINTSIATPGSNTQNVTSTIKRTTATYVFAAESTRDLGYYLFSCTGYDYASFGNATNATFKVIEAAPRSTSAFSVPGFRAPVGKV